MSRESCLVTGIALSLALGCSGVDRKFGGLSDGGAGGRGGAGGAHATQGAAAGVAGMGLDPVTRGGSGAEVDSSCAKGYFECGSKCTNLRTDANNCGACGEECATGMACASGVCRCAAGRGDCYNECVDTQLDPENCGACGTFCQVGQSCQSGACQCQSGRTRCGDACIDLWSDGDHCGACNGVCDEGQLCSQGECSDHCAADETACGNSCVDIETSEEHCGECDEACPAGQSCQEGQCSCPDGRLACDGTCVDPTDDPDHCGACGAACARGASCRDEECACPPGQDVCDDQCVDLSEDVGNCGRCGVACRSPNTCVRGVCFADTGGTGAGGEATAEAGSGGAATGGTASGGAATGGTASGGTATGGAPNGGAAGTTDRCEADEGCPSERPYCSSGSCAVCRDPDVACIDGTPASCVNGSWELGDSCPDAQVCTEGQCVCTVDDNEPKTTLVRHPLLGCGQKWVEPSEPGHAWIVFAEGVPVHVDVSHGLAWTNGAGSTDQAGAAAACASMERGGLSDWRLPTIDEGRALLVGCEAMSPGGDCPLSSGCLAESCNDASLCPTCQSGHGPHASGSYQHPACQLESGFYYFHTSSFCSDCDSSSTWTVYAPNAAFTAQPTTTLRNPKCVHAAPVDLL